MKVAIVGCGPSGLLAAHAASQLRAEVRIFTDKKRKSMLTGAMYLHTNIPGLTRERPESTILIKKFGTKEGYARKVYGSDDHPVSWDHFEEGTFGMWSLRKAYDRAWEIYHDRIVKESIDRQGLLDLSRAFDLTVCTAPKPAFCLQTDLHSFNRQNIWVRMYQPGNDSEATTMVYSGDPKHPWYRYSRIDDMLSYEYATEPPFNGLRPGRKPTGNDCDCWPTVLWAGRFGAWRKGVLTHHVFQETFDAVHSML
jgi:hypothetical protein